MQSLEIVSTCYSICFLGADAIVATTLQDVRLAVAQEEAAQVALGKLPRHKMSLSAFLLAGFELEDSQYVIWKTFRNGVPSYLKNFQVSYSSRSI